MFYPGRVPSECLSSLAASEQCSVYGDPHYRTFDGLSYLFRGRMTYTLIKTVDALPTGVAPLIVEGRNKVYLPWSPVYLHEIIVVIYGYTVQLRAQLELVVRARPGPVGVGRRPGPWEATENRRSQGSVFSGKFPAWAGLPGYGSRNQCHTPLMG